MNLLLSLLERATVQKAATPEELQYLQRAADILSQELGLGNHEIIITFDPPYDLDKSQGGATIGLGKIPRKIFILIDKDISTGEKVRNLGHEMIHAQQLATGRLAILDIENGKISGEWESQAFDDLKYSKSNPWEIEAHTKEKDLQRFVLSKIGNFIQK